MYKIDPNTGEVVKVEMQGAGRINKAKTALDYSCETEDVYEEIPPLAIDAKTGEILNKTAEPIFVKTGQVNVQERIQSFRDSVDIYKILEKFALTGDPSYVNQRVGAFGDYVNIPDNINDFDAYVKAKIQEMNSLDTDLKKAAIDGEVTQDELQALVDKYVQAAIIKQTQTQQTTDGGAE